MHAESVPSSPPAGTISGPTPTTTSTNQSDPRAALRRRSSRRPSLPPPSPSSASFSPFAGLADPAFAPMLNSSPPLEFASSAAYSFSVGGSSGAVDDDDAETVTNSVTGSSQDLAALLPQLQKYLVQQQQQQQQQLQQMQGTARPVRRVSFDLPQEQLADFDHLGGGSDGTWTSVVGNALKSGLKAYILATGVKGTVAFLAAFARRRSLQHALSTVLQSESVRRTSNAVGAFTFAYKLITTLPLAASSPIESRLRRINATSAFLGGAVAGLAVFLESAANRKFVMDQLAVRSLHAVFLSGAASATSFSKARYAAAKMDVGLLAVVGAVLMYAFAVEPKLLPESVYSVMKRIVGIPEDILNLGRATVQANPVTLDAMSDAITRHGGRNMATSLVTARQFFYYSLTAARDASHVTLDGSTLAVLPALPCSVVHAHDASCTAFSMGSGIGAFTAAVPVVASVSVVPSILVSPDKAGRRPITFLKSFAIATLRTAASLAAVASLHLAVSLHHRPQAARAALRNRTVPLRVLLVLSGIASSAVAAWTEERGRRRQWMLLALPTAIRIAVAKARIPRRLSTLGAAGTAAMEAAVISAAMGVVMMKYATDVDALDPLLRKALDLVVGSA